MKKILNWTVGSFFRTIGRIIAFILIGGIFSILLLKSDIHIFDLFSFSKVSAATLKYTVTSINFNTTNVNGGVNIMNGDIYKTTTPTIYSFFRVTATCSERDSLGNCVDEYQTHFITEVCSTNNLVSSRSDYPTLSSNKFCNIDNLTKGKVYYLDNRIYESSPNYTISRNSYIAPLGTEIKYITSYAFTETNYLQFKGNTENANLINDVTNTANDIANSLNNRCPNLYNLENPFSFTASRNDYWIWGGNDLSLTSGKTYYYSFNSNYNYGSSGSTIEVFIAKDKLFNEYVRLNGKSGSFTISSTGVYSVRFDCNNNGDTCSFSNFIISEKNIPYCEFGSYLSKLDDTNNAINNLNDTLTDDNVSDATNDASNFFSNFNTNTHGLTSIVTAPLSAIKNLSNATCSPLVLPLPYVNKNLTLPCMRQIYVDNFGGFMNLYDVITLGIISYWVVVRIFALVKDFKNPEHDEIEVMEL